jgi:predicted RNA-binding Zn-ribbon protein involved in translation (DUF1610 family)
MAKSEKMKCLDCGLDMNHHAEKIDYAAFAEPEGNDDELGGVVKEVHSCPGCGKTELRKGSDYDQGRDSTGTGA